MQEVTQQISPLKKHQTEALEFLSDKPSAALFYEMGLGKTRIVLQHLDNLEKAVLDLAEGSSLPWPALVVCPLSAVSVWAREARKFGYNFKFAELTGDRADRIQMLNSDADVFVINYDGLRVINLQLLAKNFATVIFDESHRIKERSAQQTKIAMELAAKAKRRYIMSGTPVAKSPEDVWTQFQVVDSSILGNFYAFRNRYIDYKTINIRVAGGTRQVQKAVRFKHLKELGEKLKPVSLRRTKKECIDLPEKIYEQRECPMTPEQAKHYHALKTSLATLLEEKQVRMASASALLQKLQQVCQGFIYDEKGVATYFASAKLNALKDILEDLPHEKVILFTWFKADIERIAKEISGNRQVLVYEGTTAERAAIETHFQTTQDPVIFLANIERAKESITLTAASHVIYYGNSWSYASRCQSEDRAHRIGQKNNVVYIDLVCPNTIDENVQAILQRKGAMADSITGDTLRMARIAAGLEAE